MSRNSGGSTVASSVSPVTPVIVATMGTTRSISAGGLQSSVFRGTLDQSSCALTFTNFNAAGLYNEILVQLVGASGKAVTFTDSITWKGGNAPVISTTGVTEFVVYSLGDGNLYGAHDQQVRTILWSPGTGALTVATGVQRISIFKDTRIVNGIARIDTAPTGASVLIDVKKNGTTIYTTQANRPAIAASTNSSGNITLPDITALAAGDYLTFDVAQVGSTIAGSNLTVALRVLEAA